MIHTFFGRPGVVVGVKTCRGLCGRTLPAERFDRMTAATDGLQFHCKECHHYRHVHPIAYRGCMEEVRLIEEGRPGHMTREEAMKWLRKSCGGCTPITDMDREKKGAVA